jgi:hypothetical protein
MTWNLVMGFVTTVVLVVPIVIIVFLKLLPNKYFITLAVYYLLAFVFSLMTEGYIPVTIESKKTFGLISNLLDGPLLLFFLSQFASSAILKRQIRIIIIAYIAYEILTIAIFGLNKKAITFTLGPGIILIVVFSLLFFLRLASSAITERKETGKALVSASILFAYFCYGILYLFRYVFKVENLSDLLLIFYWTTCLSVILMCVGILSEGKKAGNWYKQFYKKKTVSF